MTITLFLLFDIELLIFSILNMMYPETFPLLGKSLTSITGLTGTGGSTKKEVFKTTQEEELARELRKIEIPTHFFLTSSYLLSIFWFFSILASIPIIVCLVNHSPDSDHSDKHTPITHPDYTASTNTNKVSLTSNTANAP